MIAPLSASIDPVVVIQAGREQWRFSGLVTSLVAFESHEVASALAAAERYVSEEGYYAAGYLAYEAAAAYGLAVHAPREDDPPLLWFGIFQERAPISLATDGGYAFGEWTPALDESAYRVAVGAIKDAIADGYTYQANLTFHLTASFQGDPWALYGALCHAQQASYTAYIDLGRHVICSASPELFFRRDGDTIVSRPMKGTAPRGLSAADDRAQAAWLHNSEKNRAENVMIVDMIRNDLGRVANVGSVRVPELFTVERYPTLLQMTSTVIAESEASFSQLMRAAFPCASITGAPKVRTMQLLRDLEQTPRGIYTGAIGMIGPDRQAQFNVAIRTVVLDRETGTARYGVGSGIVWDSDAGAEYAECLLKARVLEPNRKVEADFSLLESLRWTPDDGYWLLDRHLDRLEASAEYFNFPVARAETGQRLAEFAQQLEWPAKVRLLVAGDGRMTLQAERLSGELIPPVRIGLAKEPVSTQERWLYHKTTRRGVYDRARTGRPDCDDVVLYNERDEITETTTANLVVELDGALYTPPIACGLLPGTLREELLARGEIAERVIAISDLFQAERILLINSVRGSRPAHLIL